MTENDIKGVFDISNSCFSVPWSMESIEGEIHNPLAKYIVAKDEASNLVVGEGSITNIAVHPEYRKQGIGAKLLESLINLCTDLDCSLINLEVRASNYPAQNLYKKYGFIVDGLRKGYYTDNKEDAVLMTKSL